MDGDATPKNSVDGVIRHNSGPMAYTIPEAAKKLQLGKSTVWDLVAKGEIRSFTVGRSRRIRSAVLEEWMQAREAAGQPGSAA